MLCFEINSLCIAKTECLVLTETSGNGTLLSKLTDNIDAVDQGLQNG